MLGQKLLVDLLVLQILDPVTVHLLPQIVDNLNQPLILCRLVDQFMEMDVCLRQICDIAFLHQIFKILSRPGNLLQMLLIDPFAGKLHGQLLQSQTHLQHIIEILLRDLGHLGSLAGNHNHQSFQLQLADGLPHRRPADSQPVSQRYFHQPLARFQLSMKNCLPQCVEHHIPKRKIFIHIHMKIRCHLYFLHFPDFSRPSCRGPEGYKKK